MSITKKDLIEQALVSVEVTIGYTLNKMKAGFIPDPEGLTVQELLAAANTINAHVPLLPFPDASQSEQAQTWIPVSERVPQDRKAVLVWCPERRNIYACTMDIRKALKWHHFAPGGDALNEEATHWMPIPAPPSLHP